MGHVRGQLSIAARRGARAAQGAFLQLFATVPASRTLERGRTVAAPAARSSGAPRAATRGGGRRADRSPPRDAPAGRSPAVPRAPATAAAAPYTPTSSGRTPNRNALMLAPSHQAPAPPIARPAPSRTAACCRTFRSTPPGVAPSAIRRPISAVCCATAYDITPYTPAVAMTRPRRPSSAVNAIRNRRCPISRSM